MSDPSSRPAPQYGEYASPEEVREALGQPAPPNPAQRLHPETPPPAPHGAAVPPAPAPQTREAPPRRWDRILTLALLGVGLFHLITSAPGLLSFDEYLERGYAALGVAGMDLGTATRVVGQVMLVGYGLIYAATAATAWRRLLEGRLAFWVPLIGIGSVLTMMALGTIAIILVDPGFVAGVEAPPSG